MTGINRAVLDDGSVLLTDTGASTGVTAGAVWVRGGSRAERDAEAGAAHLLEHLAFSARIGSSGKSALESMDRIGARPTALTSKEHTAYSIRTRALDFDLGLQALVSAIVRPDFSQESFEQESSAIRNELDGYQADPFRVAIDSLEAVLLGDVGLAGSRQIVGPSIGTVRAFWQRNYVAPNLVFAIAGDVDHLRCLEAVSRCSSAVFELHGELRAEGDQVLNGPSFPNFLSSSDVRLVPHSSPVGCVAIGFLAPSTFHDDSVVVRVLDAVISAGVSNRLTEALRHRRPLAYETGSFYSGYSDTGTFVMFARTHGSVHEEVLQEMRYIIASIAAGNIGATEFERSRQHLIAGTAISLEDSRVRVARLASSELYGPLRGHPEAGADALHRVTREDVIRVAADLQKSTLTSVFVGREN